MTPGEAALAKTTMFHLGGEIPRDEQGTAVIAAKR